MKKILILGGSGMLGHQLYKTLRESHNVKVTVRGSVGSLRKYKLFRDEEVREFVDATDFDSVIRATASFKPDIVINCIGLIKQLPESEDPLWAITGNAQLPHRISLICASAKARMIHISTDCVFSGKKGAYTEDDISDAEDLYGRTKYLGEVAYKPHTITLRTSIIGHELKSHLGLVEWFLRQQGSVQGFKNAIFSGVTTNELAKIISNYVIPNENLTGVYHVSAAPISKYDLLCIIRDVYKKDIEIKPFTEFSIDRSLNSDNFQHTVDYHPPSWEDMITEMHQAGPQNDT